MESALGAANWLLGKALSKLSDELVAGYVASSELGLNFDNIKNKLNFTLALLHAAQGRDVTNNPGLHGLLEDLSRRADEAEDALDELHYFRIRDKLDGTNMAEPWIPDNLHGQVVHGRAALRHCVGNCLACFSCSHTQDDAGDLGVNPQDNHDIDQFDRVVMSNRIKSVIERMHSLCDPISTLLNIPNSNNPVGGMPTTRVTTPLIQQDKLYGRDAIFKQTLSDMISGTICHETISVLPIYGTGGIGKTTFAQHLYKETKDFTARAWVCVSTNFDVFKLTKGILASLLANESDDSHRETDSDNLERLQQSIMKRLKYKKFLVVLDDIWEYSQEKWESLLAPLKNSDPKKGSIVLVTTRSYGIARDVKTTNPIHLKGLEGTEFREFFQEYVLGQVTDEYDNKCLIDVARQIADKLKGSPLAAKTVGRLMKKSRTLEHWKGILEREEWRNETNNDDIMPALKISYDYLPFDLKKCFTFLALFPEDHRFRKLEITCFWSAIGIIESRNNNDKIEDIGSRYLDELVDHCFLLKEYDYNYVLHDLLHELARTISSQECINICSSSLEADRVPPSIRHLSVTMSDKCSIDFEQEMTKLKNTIDIANLRTLMIFGSYDTSVDHVLKNAFEKVKHLRVLFIRMNTEESLPNNFPNLIHLRFLKIHSPTSVEISLPSTLSQFYHLKFLDLEDFNSDTKMPERISRLCNIRHFFAGREFHSNVPEVGKWKNLQRLKEFHVNKGGRVGFDIGQLGDLTELGGALRICNLEEVKTKEEAIKARLTDKKNLNELILIWREQQLPIGADVLDSLQPHSNLRELSIINPPGSIGPSWLCSDICLQNLEFLYLEGVSWATLPPFGEMPHLRELSLKNVTGWRQFKLGGFAPLDLESIKFECLPELVEWVTDETCELFPLLNGVRCIDCPMLSKLPILGFPNLRNLLISECPKLSLPPMPHTSTLNYVFVDHQITYRKSSFEIKGYKGDLVFQHLGEVQRMDIVNWSVGRSNENQEEAVLELELSACKSLQTFRAEKCSNLVIPIEDGGPLRDLMSLHRVDISDCERMFSQWSTEDVTQIMNPFPATLEKLRIDVDKSMQSMGLFSNLTSLTSLLLTDCKRLTIDGFNPLITMNLKRLTIFGCGTVAADLLSEVARMADTLRQGDFPLEHLEVDNISAVLVAPICSRLTATLKSLHFVADKEAEGFTEEQERALQLLTSLKIVRFARCKDLQSLPEALHCLPSLRDLLVYSSPRLKSLPKKDLPASLVKLRIHNCSPEIVEEGKILKATRPNLELRQ